MSRAWIRTITKYFEDFLEGEIGIEGFCAGYERWWNFDIPTDAELTGNERVLLEKVFKVVTAYSPYDLERNEITIYKSGEEVREIVEQVLSVLKNQNAA